VSILGFVLLVIIAAVAGAVGQALAGYSLGGCLVSAVVGFIGAFIGMWLAGALGLPTIFAIDIEGQSFPIVWSIIGSFIFTLVVGLITRSTRRTI
jgi:uncharacterized membrane protein YeaQ/YmgE (transglycosylase-associated protein family)